MDEIRSDRNRNNRSAKGDVIQLQKVAEISEAVMRMMGQDLMENAALLWNHRQRGFKGLEDLWRILRILVKGNFQTSLQVSLSSYFQVLTFNIYKSSFTTTCWCTFI